MIRYPVELRMKPDLLYDYRDANREVFGFAPHVGIKSYPRFEVMEMDLDELGIDKQDFAETVICSYAVWAKKYKAKCVPIRMFCADSALRRYMRVSEYQTVELRPSHDEEILYTELLVQRSYLWENLSGSAIRMRDVIRNLRPILDPRWVVLYDDKDERRPIMRATDILADEYMVTHYKHIGDVLQAVYMERHG